MTPADGTSFVAKVVEAAKDLPVWILTALPVAAAVMLFLPQVTNELPKDLRPWLLVSFVLFGVLAAFKWLDVGIAAWRAARAAAMARKTFHLTPIPQECHWSIAKQPDGTWVTQVVAHFAVKNQKTTPVRLLRARIIKPKIRGEIVTEMIDVRAPNHRIPPGTTVATHVFLMVSGKPATNAYQNLAVTLAISDDDGNEQRISVECRAPRQPKTSEASTPLEALHAITDPIAKDVASVLQAEVARYESNGRREGGLGSVHILMGRKEIRNLGSDARTLHTTANQEISVPAVTSELKSDNLDALLVIHGRLASDDERKQFADALLSRLNDNKGYARVAYLIVLALWKIGLLREALEASRKGLKEGDRITFGLSNTLMLLNGLLRYRYCDFTSDMLDTIEGHLRAMNEHSFRIPQKIAAIRAQRLITPAGAPDATA